MGPICRLSVNRFGQLLHGESYSHCRSELAFDLEVVFPNPLPAWSLFLSRGCRAGYFFGRRRTGFYSAGAENEQRKPGSDSRAFRDKHGRPPIPDEETQLLWTLRDLPHPLGHFTHRSSIEFL